MPQPDCVSGDVVPGDSVRLRLDLGYDGTDFNGWARQKTGVPTVQQTIEEALRVIVRLPSDPELTVAGRTDAGVHARGQVAHVDLPAQLWRQFEPSLLRRLAGVLPPTIRIHRIAPAPPGFDARFAATSRRYAYRVWTGEGGPDPLRRFGVFWHPQPLEVAAMNAAAQPLLGEHDFAAFCKKRKGANVQATTVRCLQRCHWQAEPGFPGSTTDILLTCEVVADAFCHSMVRALVGGLVVVGEGRRPVDWPAQVLASGVRDSGVQVLPAHGLTLEEVTYPPDADLAARVTTTRRLRA